MLRERILGLSSCSITACATYAMISYVVANVAVLRSKQCSVERPTYVSDQQLSSQSEVFRFDRSMPQLRASRLLVEETLSDSLCS